MVCSIRYSSFYQDCSFDDLGMTLTFLWQGQIWDNANILLFMESFECFGQKNGNKSCLNEYTKINE